MHYQSVGFMRYVHQNSLSELYFSVVLKTLALSMVGIFIPVYMYKELNYSLNQIIYFFLIWSILFAVLTPVVAKFASRFGLKHMIVASVPFEISFIGVMLLMKTYNISYIYPAILYAISGTLFWTGFNIEFAKVTKKKNRGSEIGFLYFLVITAEILGPFFGGVILSYIGFSTLFYTASILLVTGVIPLLASKDDHVPVKFSFKNIYRKRYARDMITFLGLGARYMSASVFWPLFIFIMLGSYFDLGALATGAGLITAFSSFFVGKLADRMDNKKMLDIGAIIHSITWTIRWFASSFFQLFIIEIASGLSFIFASIPFSSIFYNKMMKRNKVEYIVFREIGFTFGKVITLLFVLLTGNLVVSFLVAGVASLAYMVFSEK